MGMSTPAAKSKYTSCPASTDVDCPFVSVTCTEPRYTATSKTGSEAQISYHWALCARTVPYGHVTVFGTAIGRLMLHQSWPEFSVKRSKAGVRVVRLASCWLYCMSWHDSWTPNWAWAVPDWPTVRVVPHETGLVECWLTLYAAGDPGGETFTTGDSAVTESEVYAHADDVAVDAVVEDDDDPQAHSSVAVAAQAQQARKRLRRIAHFPLFLVLVLRGTFIEQAAQALHEIPDAPPPQPLEGVHQGLY